MAHRVIRPPVLYVGTPVLLLATENADGSPNLAPASSYWALGRMVALGLETDGHTLANLRERPQLTINFPSPALWPAVERIGDLTGRAEVPAATSRATTPSWRPRSYGSTRTRRSHPKATASTRPHGSRSCTASGATSRWGRRSGERGGGV